MDPSVVTLGVFDGMHRGHQEVIQKTVEWSQALRVRAIVVTFAIHPATILAGRDVPPLQSLEQRLEMMESLGIDLVLPLPFDRAMASQTPDFFVHSLLVSRLGVQGILLGHDTTFGRHGAGNLKLLQSLGPSLGFEARQVEPILYQEQPISSTRIRASIAQGELVSAQAMLGHPFTTRGEVIRGSQRGRTLGFPTANLCPTGSLLPPGGVYGGRVRLPNESKNALINIGSRPTFAHKEGALDVVVEAHLLDWTGDLYGSTIDIEWMVRLRDEMRFDSENDLCQQIGRDRHDFESFLSS